MFVASCLRFARTIFAVVVGLSTFNMQAFAADSGAPDVAASPTRYVWAKNLVMHAEPDSKAAQVAKLPYGTEVAMEPTDSPKSFQETWLKVHYETAPTTDVVLSGHWQKVRAAQGEGWVFDGYLSRYPVPTAKELKSYSSDSSSDGAEALYTKRLFHVKTEYKWSGKDSKNTAAFRLMMKRQKLEKSALTDEINWNYIEFSNGVTYEFFSNMDGISQSNEELKKIPLSFNEAMLWLNVFQNDYPINESGKSGSPRSGEFKAGHSLQVGPADDETGIAHGESADCNGNTCDLSNGVAD